MTQSFANGIQHLQSELQRLDLLLLREVERLRETGQFVDDPFRGLHLSDSYIDAVLRPKPASPDKGSEPLARLDRQIADCLHPSLPLCRLRRLFSLSDAEVFCLVLAAAVELSDRYERLFAYAQNDVTRKRPTVGLALRLLSGDGQWLPSESLLFHPTAPLFRHGLLRFSEDQQDRDPPLPVRALRVEPRVLDFLLDRNQPDRRLDAIVAHRSLGITLDETIIASQLATALREAAAARLLICCLGAAGTGRHAAIQALYSELGRGTLTADLRQLPPDMPVDHALDLLLRDAALLDCGLCLQLVESAAPEHRHPAMLQPPHFRRLAEALVPVAILSNSPVCPPGITHSVVRFPPLSVADRQRLWEQQLAAAGLSSSAGEAATLAGQFQLSADQIEAAIRMALRNSTPNDARLTDDMLGPLRSAARLQAAGTLGKLARRIEYGHDWNDLVVAPDIQRQLQDIVASVRCRGQVLGEWGFEQRLPYGRGIVCLFSGPSGTGKTMSAGIIARALGMDLFAIDLSTMFSKYIGEMEKHVSQLFADARSINAMIFIDEADAVLGKRVAVNESRDLFANIGVAHLLQKLEEHEGVVILATNLSANMDDAFTRRIQHRVEFLLPDAALRERIWRGSFPPGAPLSDEIDFGFMARQFEISGGNICSVALGAAYDASDRGERIGMRHLIPRIARELQKLGRIPSRSEFRQYGDLMQGLRIP